MKLLIKDRFFHNADVLRRFALSFEYQDSSKILTDVGWRGHRTEEFDLLDNKIINEASQNILETVSKFYNLKGYSITSHFHISTEETKKTLDDFDNDKYHKDQCEYAGVVYLKPNPPRNTGTSLLNGKENKIVNIKNRYNRLLAYPAHFAHAPTDLFGEDFYTGRMTLTFFMKKDWTWD